MEIMYIGVGIFLVWLVRTLPNTHPERVRLSGIDCPEKGQAFCSNAEQGGLTPR
jgi:endonuclease YncB( thermonuclease family)